jgi:hypothetical protein
VSWPARASLWATLSVALLLGGLLAIGALFARGLPRDIRFELASAVALQALIPLWAATFATWLVAARLAPALERSLGRVALGVAAAATLWFPLIGGVLFIAWEPRGAADWAGTWLLMVAAVTAALLLPRWGVRALRSGVFAPDARRGNVAG